jgi:hypothetical protein
VSNITKPFFVVSSGRSGTAMLQKALSAERGVEMHHEYMVHIVQPLAVRRYLGLIDARTARQTLAETHVAAVRCSTAAFWGDSSNKLSWLIPDLAELLPQAKFIHLVRDGRKVAGSYFRKLGSECYDDRSTAILQAHYDSPNANAAPPPEKKYWWPVPRRGEPVAKDFRSFDQFARIAWHWAEINRVILKSLATLPAERSMHVQLEDLCSSPDFGRALYNFLGIAWQDSHFSIFSRPHNVNRPEDRLLDEREIARFEAIAGPMMTRLGYSDRAEYVVSY